MDEEVRCLLPVDFTGDTPGTKRAAAARSQSVPISDGRSVCIATRQKLPSPALMPHSKSTAIRLPLREALFQVELTLSSGIPGITPGLADSSGGLHHRPFVVCAGCRPSPEDIDRRRFDAGGRRYPLMSPRTVIDRHCWPPDSEEARVLRSPETGPWSSHAGCSIRDVQRAAKGRRVEQDRGQICARRRIIDRHGDRAGDRDRPGLEDGGAHCRLRPDVPRSPSTPGLHCVAWLKATTPRSWRRRWRGSVRHLVPPPDHSGGSRKILQEGITQRTRQQDAAVAQLRGSTPCWRCSRGASAICTRWAYAIGSDLRHHPLPLHGMFPSTTVCFGQLILANSETSSTPVSRILVQCSTALLRPASCFHRVPLAVAMGFHAVHHSGRHQNRWSALPRVMAHLFGAVEVAGGRGPSGSTKCSFAAE